MEIVRIDISGGKAFGIGEGGPSQVDFAVSGFSDLLGKEAQPIHSVPGPVSERSAQLRFGGIGPYGPPANFIVKLKSSGLARCSLQFWSRHFRTLACCIHLGLARLAAQYSSHKERQSEYSKSASQGLTSSLVGFSWLWAGIEMH